MTILSKYLSPLLLAGLSASPAYADCGKHQPAAEDVTSAAALHVAAVDDMNTDADRTMGRAIDDSVITGKVKGELIDEDDIDANDIDVDTRDGVVTLTGTVDSEEEAQRAEELARSVDGVKSVQAQLSVSQ
ncbi:MAG: BON domain-containing protein [Pseudomonadota bacterium]